MTESVNGKVERVKHNTERGYYGLKLESGEWFNQESSFPSGVSEGAKVNLQVTDNWQDDFMNIEEINVMEGGEKEEGSSSKSKAQAQNGDKPSSDYTSKDDRINKKVAFKEAAETVRNSEKDQNMNYESDQGGHIEEVSKLANGYYNILKSMGGDE